MTIGILGAGQLGRMLALAGIPLGMRFQFFDPAPAPPAAALGRHVRAAWTDQEALGDFIRDCDVITYEVEHVPLETLEWIAERATVAPGPASLRITRDRLVEKQFAASLDLPVAPYASVASADDLAAALAHTDAPAILKTRVGGYDGRGQVRIDRVEQAAEAWAALGGVEAVVERRVPFDRELALVSTRSRNGGVRLYPLIETHHRNGVLSRAVAPAPATSIDLHRQAEGICRRVLDALNHVGVMTIECFELDGRLLINELAPRVHNSGHWTIEGAETSQFENHVRAIAGLPLGETTHRGVAGLVNLIGSTPPADHVLGFPGAHLHVYGKDPRPGRKVGHVTVLAATHAELDARMQGLASLWTPAS